MLKFYALKLHARCVIVFLFIFIWLLVKIKVYSMFVCFAFFSLLQNFQFKWIYFIFEISKPDKIKAPTIIGQLKMIQHFAKSIVYMTHTRAQNTNNNWIHTFNNIHKYFAKSLRREKKRRKTLTKHLRKGISVWCTLATWIFGFNLLYFSAFFTTQKICLRFFRSLTICKRAIKRERKRTIQTRQTVEIKCYMYVLMCSYQDDFKQQDIKCNRDIYLSGSHIHRTQAQALIIWMWLFECNWRKYVGK